MWFSSCLQKWTSNRLQRKNAQRRGTPPRFRPRLEALEDRCLPSNYTAGSVPALITDINAANQAGGTNTINLTDNTTFDLTAVNNTTNGVNGLPIISGGGKKVAADNLTIIGNGDIIQRDSAAPAFRLFDVASGGSLTLENVTLQGGLAFGSGTAADGGAIYNLGTLTLINTIVQDNTAQGSNGAAGAIKNRNQIIAPQAGADAEGGGIWTNGTVKLENGTLIGITNGYYPLYGQGNKALGGHGGAAGGQLGMNGGAGGGGFGGGLYQAGGSVTVTDATLAGNVAVGGYGGSDYARSSISGYGGGASGGGLYIASGTLVMSSNDTVKTNWAMGGNGGQFFAGNSHEGGTGGAGSGGGIYVGSGTVTLQSVALLSNRAQGGDGGMLNLTGGVTDAFWQEVHGLGGNGSGGGLYVGGGTVTLTGVTVTGNAAGAGVSGGLGIPNGSPGVASGGGIYIVSQATLSLDLFTVSHTTSNYDYNQSGLNYIQTEDDIDGSYTLT